MNRWENSLTHRYYEARITRGLFGDWAILRTWGRIGSRLGGSRTDFFSSEQACGQALDNMARRRQARELCADGQHSFSCCENANFSVGVSVP
jgi:predicted DNA-binding WGR domain protein